MSVYLIKMEKGHKVARPITTEEEYKMLRNKPVNLKNLELARGGDEKAKSRLVQFNYSGHFPNGMVKGNRLPSKAFGFDLDCLEDFERAAALLLAAPEKYGLLMLERSARQGGHAVLKREPGRTILENQVRIATALKCEMDTNAHDINRVYYSTSAQPEDLLYLSPELFLDEYQEAEVAAEAQALEYRREELPEGAHRADKHYKPWEESSQNSEQETKAGERVFSENFQEEDTAELEEDTAGFDENPENEITLKEPNYQGIPYDLIIRKWWELYNGGKEPVKSNRDVLTFELAVNLRHICGFDRQLLDKVIPCYDGFPQDQKMKCIDSALAERRTQMPKRLRDVLDALCRENTDNAELLHAVSEVNAQDELLYFRRLRGMPLGVKDSIMAAGPALAMPVITAITSAIGMLATGVKVNIHSKYQHLNIISYIAGEAGSGKGQIDPILDAWLHDIQLQDNVYLQQEREWRMKKRAAKNAKQQPEEPQLPVRILTLNNTLANIAERLSNTDGLHCFSFTPEADTVSQKWRQSISDFSVLIRQAYDGSSFSREAKSADAVSVHIKELLWNIVMCGTADALYRLVTNYTDGLLSRFAISRTPDNTFARLEDRPYILTERQQERIQMVAHLLPLMAGEISLPKLEEQSRIWVEKIRIQAMKNDDKVMARCRLRDHVTAFRMTTCLMLCLVCERLIKQYGLNGAEQRLKADPNLWKRMLQKAQTPAMMEAYDTIADSLLDNDLYFFGEKIARAYENNESAQENRIRMGKNDSIYERLPEVFTLDMAYQHSLAVKGAMASRNAARMMLKNWRKQGIVILCEDGTYKKTGH